MPAAQWGPSGAASSALDPVASPRSATAINRAAAARFLKNVLPRGIILLSPLPDATQGCGIRLGSRLPRLQLIEDGPHRLDARGTWGERAVVDDLVQRLGKRQGGDSIQWHRSVSEMKPQAPSNGHCQIASHVVHGDGGTLGVRHPPSRPRLDNPSYRDNHCRMPTRYTSYRDSKADPSLKESIHKDRRD